MLLSDALRPLREILEWMPFQLDDFDAVNHRYDRWLGAQESEDLDIILKWMYVFTYRYVVIRVFRSDTLSSVDIDYLHTTLFSRAQAILDSEQVPEQLAPYIAVLCRNAYNSYRRDTARRKELVRRKMIPADNEDDPFREPLSQDYVTLKLELDRAIHRLPKKLQHVISKRFFEGLSYATIAADTGHTPATLRSLTHRALQRLHKDSRLAGLFRDWDEA